MFFRLFYIMFVVSAILLGSIHVGSFTYRQIFAVLMFLFCLNKNGGLGKDRSWVAYVIFIFFFGLTSLLSGNLTQYVKTAIGFYFVAYVTCCSTCLVVRKYGFPVFCHTLMGIGLVNALVTIFVAVGSPWAIGVARFFTPLQAEAIEDSFAEGDLVTFSIMGIVEATTNGFLIMISVCLSFIYIVKYRTIFKWLPFLLCLVASFVCQQRASFAFVVIFSVFFLIRYFSTLSIKYKVLLALMLVFVSIYIVPFFIEFSEVNDMRYSAYGLDSTGRNKIYDDALTYMSTHMFSANIFDFRNVYHHSPHQLFYNMFIYGGVGGFIAIAFTVFLHMKLAMRYIIQKIDDNSVALFATSGAMLGFFVISLSHNTSIVSGSELYWMLWGALISHRCYTNGMRV